MTGTVLITGSDGFTGKYVAREFANRGWEVWGSGQRATNLRKRYANIDLLDPSTLAIIQSAIRPDVVIHLAAISYVGEEDASAFYKVNILGTKFLLDTLCSYQGNLQHVVLASSAAIYGNVDKRKIPECCPAKPTNDYGVSKLAMEYLANTYLDKLPITITRPFNYTGLGQHPRFLIPKLVHHFKTKAPTIQLGNLDVARELSDVRDVSFIYAELASKPALGDAVNICSGQAYGLPSILATLENLTGHSIRTEVAPGLVRTQEILSLCGDTAKLEEHVILQDRRGMENTLSWMLAA